jgi:hypothetical protein
VLEILAASSNVDAHTRLGDLLDIVDGSNQEVFMRVAMPESHSPDVRLSQKVRNSG